MNAANDSITVLYSGDAFAAIQNSFFVRSLPLVTPSTILVGIRSGGDILADRLALRVQQDKGFLPEVGYLDISLYRDDFAHRSHWPAVQETQIPNEIEGREILLIDEVLFTGRTIRAAIDALLDLGRPSRIQLAVLFDRCCRELPIQPDVAGQKVEIDRSSSLLVEFVPRAPLDRAVSFVKVDR